MKRRGLTIIETMVAMVILGFITAALALVFRMHMGISRPIQEQSDMIHDARAAFDILSREIRHTTAIEQGRPDSIQFRAMVGGTSQRYKYAIRGGFLKREAGGGGMQEVVANAARLRFRYYRVDGGEVSPPITNANDQTVARIAITVAVMLPDHSDTLTLNGSIAPRNL